MSDKDIGWLAAAVPGAKTGLDGLGAARLGSERLAGRGGFGMTSAAFQAGGELDASFTAIEEDAVAPPLEWTAPPPGTMELVLLVECPETGASCHWLVWGLPGQRGQLLEGEAPPRVGKNAAGNSEWLLPHPPVGETHRYVFQLFASELPSTLMPGASREDVLASLEGNVTALAILSASFTGTEPEDDDLADWDADS